MRRSPDGGKIDFKRERPCRNIDANAIRGHVFPEPSGDGASHRQFLAEGFARFSFWKREEHLHGGQAGGLECWKNVMLSI